MPPIRAITPEAFEAELRDEASEDDTFTQRTWGKGLALFGLVPAAESFEEAAIREQVENVVAFYRREEKDVTILIRDDNTRDASSAVLTLSHEYVHALQDRREDLEALFDRWVETSDDSLALRSLVEGEAVALSNIAILSARELSVSRVLWDDYFDDWLMARMSDVVLSDRPLLAARSLVYPVGGRGALEAYLAGGMARVRKLYEKPALTFRSWSYAPPVALEPEPMDCEPPEPPAGYTLSVRDRQGMAGLISLYAALGVGARYDEAHAWLSDWYALYSDESEESEEVAVAWRLRFGSAAAAERFYDGLPSARRAIQAELSGQEVLLTTASSEDLLADWDRTGGCEASESRAQPLRRHAARESWRGHGSR